MTFAISPPYKLNVLAQATGLPAWYTSAGVSQWTDLNAPHPSPGTGAFSSAVINTTGLYIGNTFVAGTWMCTFGGGHGDSLDNAVYAFGPLESAVPAWNKLSQTVIMGDDVKELNGYPCSPHSYDSMNYFPVRNWMHTGIAAIPPNGNAPSSHDTWIFDFNVPNPMVNNPDGTARCWTKTGVNVGNMEECASCYDSVVDRVFMLRLTTNMGQFVPGASPSAGVWSQYVGGTGLLPIASKAAFHPSRLMVLPFNAFATTQTTALGVINLNTGGVSFVTPSGTPPTVVFQRNDHSSIDWVPSQNKFAHFTDTLGNGALGNRTIHWITTGPDPLTLTGWAWSSQTPAGGITPNFGPQQQGIYGRFRAVDNGAGLRGLFLLVSINQGVARLVFWRLP